MKKFFGTALTLTLAMSLVLVNSSFASTKTDTGQTVTKEMIKEAEKTQADEDTVYEKEYEKMQDELNEYIKQEKKNNNGKVDKKKIKNKAKELKGKYKKIINQKIGKYEEENGWVPVEQPRSVSTKSVSIDLTMSDDSLSKSSTTGQYKYTGTWDWDEEGWDYEGDIEDLLAVVANEKIDIVKSYAKAYQRIHDLTDDSYGDIRSGYDNNGSTEGWSVSKRDENSYGIIWNIDDGGTNYCDYDDCKNVYDTDNGRATVYFLKRGTTSNKIFTKFEHNYSEEEPDVSASFSVEPTTVSGGIDFEYQTVNLRFQRTSSGKSF